MCMYIPFYAPNRTSIGISIIDVGALLESVRRMKANPTLTLTNLTPIQSLTGWLMIVMLFQMQIGHFLLIVRI